MTPEPTEAPTPGRPLLDGPGSPTAWAAATLATASPMLPWPWSAAALVASAVAAIIAGRPLDAPRWAQGSTLYRRVLVPLLGALGGVSALSVADMPPSLERHALVLLAVLAFLACGRVMPAPKRAG